MRSARVPQRFRGPLTEARRAADRAHPTLRTACARRLLEILQPAERDGVADRAGATQLVRRLAPVEADPARGVFLRSLDKAAELLYGAAQRKRFLDHDRFADIEARERVQRFVHFSAFRIDMHADEIQI